MKIGHCEEILDSTWRKYVKGKNGVRPPKALCQCRKALKFATAVFSSDLNTEDLNEALLNTDNNEKI